MVYNLKIEMKKIILSLVLVFGLLFIGNSQVKAAAGDSVFGNIEAPVGVKELNAQAGAAGSNIGLLIFVSNMIKFASIIAGIWVMFNFITAGFTYITAAGDSSAYAKIGTNLSLSVSGLVLIVAAYTIAGIISLIIFGDPTFIINPQIPTAIPTSI